MIIHEQESHNKVVRSDAVAIVEPTATALEHVALAHLHTVDTGLLGSYGLEGSGVACGAHLGHFDEGLHHPLQVERVVPSEVVCQLSTGGVDRQSSRTTGQLHIVALRTV